MCYNYNNISSFLPNSELTPSIYCDVMTTNPYLCPHAGIPPAIIRFPQLNMSDAGNRDENPLLLIIRPIQRIFIKIQLAVGVRPQRNRLFFQSCQQNNVTYFLVLINQRKKNTNSRQSFRVRCCIKTCRNGTNTDGPRS